MPWEHYCISYRSLTHCWLVIHYWSRNFKLLWFIYQGLFFFFFLRKLIIFASFQIKIEFYSWKIHCSWNASYWIQFRGNWVKYNDLWKWSNFIIRLTREALRSVSLWSLVEAFRLFEPAPLYTVITFLKKSSSLSSETEKISQNNYLLLQLYW